MSIKYSCGDFLEFQDSLKKMRDLDDKIIYALNTSIPTESFKGMVDGASTCKVLYDQLQMAHRQRDTAIRQCILASADNVKGLKERRDHNRDDVTLDKQFKSEQRKLRVLQSELNIEDILKERTFKTFNERCRSYFKADML